MNHIKYLAIFDVMLGECLLSHTDNLSKSLQSPRLTSSEGQSMAELTC